MCANFRAITLATAVVALIGVESSTAYAQSYPSRTVKAIVDTGAGGIYDIFARVLAEELHKKWGQPVIVDPRPVGNGIVGTRACAEADPDGYTICLLSNRFVTNEFFYKTRPYSLSALKPVTNLFFNTLVVVANSQLGVRTIDELVALAKAKPGTLSYSVPSGFQRAFFDNLNKKHGIDLVAVPFKSGADTITGVLSGNIPIAYIGAFNYAPLVREGKVAALAVESGASSPLFPGTPTLTELGYTEPIVRSYNALMVPAGTPQPIVDKLHADVAAIMNDPTFRQRQVIDRAFEPVVDTPEAFAKFIEADLARTGEAAKKLGIEPQ